MSKDIVPAKSSSKQAKTENLEEEDRKSLKLSFRGSEEANSYDSIMAPGALVLGRLKQKINSKSPTNKNPPALVIKSAQPNLFAKKRIVDLCHATVEDMASLPVMTAQQKLKLFNIYIAPPEVKVHVPEPVVIIIPKKQEPLRFSVKKVQVQRRLPMMSGIL